MFVAGTMDICQQESEEGVVANSSFTDEPKPMEYDVQSTMWSKHPIAARPF